MNDTTQTLIRSVLKIGAGYLLSKGLIDSSHSEELISALAGVIAVVWGIVHRAPASSNVKPITGAPLLWIVLLPVLALALPGCGTSAQKVSYKAAVGAQTTATAAMIGWGAYVGAYHPSTNAESQVKAYFQSYKAAELSVIDATSALANNPSATNAVTAAVLAEQAAQNDLINLVISLTNSVTLTK